MKSNRISLRIDRPKPHVDPLDKEINRILTTLHGCRNCTEIKSVMAQYIAREKDRATARRLAVEAYAERLGQRAYEGYRDHTGGVSLATGGPIPVWVELNPAIKAAWGAAAKALLSEES
jgi:hypothetical protein